MKKYFILISLVLKVMYTLSVKNYYVVTTGNNTYPGTTYARCVSLAGKGNIISHCTLTRSGRTVLDYGDMYQALVQHCDMSHSGLLTSDLGLSYGNVIEGGNSEIRYNVLHHNDDDHLDMGLYTMVHKTLSHTTM